MTNTCGGGAPRPLVTLGRTGRWGVPCEGQGVSCSHCPSSRAASRAGSSREKAALQSAAGVVARDCFKKTPLSLKKG